MDHMLWWSEVDQITVRRVKKQASGLASEAIISQHVDTSLAMQSLHQMKHQCKNTFYILNFKLVKLLNFKLASLLFTKYNSIDFFNSIIAPFISFIQHNSLIKEKEGPRSNILPNPD